MIVSQPIYGVVVGAMRTIGRCCAVTDNVRGVTFGITMTV